MYKCTVNLSYYGWPNPKTGWEMADGPLQFLALHIRTYTTCHVQVGSLSVGYTSRGDKRLLVSQPGGTYIPLCAGATDDNRSVLCVCTCTYTYMYMCACVRL